MCFFYCFLDSLFVRFWQSWACKGGPFWSPFSQIFQILHEKKCAEIEARKLMTFGGLLGGAGGGGRGLSNSSDSAEWWVDPITPCSPCGGAANLMGYALCRRPPIIAHCFRIADSLHCCKRVLVFLERKLVIWHDWWLHFGVLGDPGPILGHWGA